MLNDNCVIIAIAESLGLDRFQWWIESTLVNYIQSFQTFINLRQMFETKPIALTNILSVVEHNECGKKFFSSSNQNEEKRREKER